MDLQSLWNPQGSVAQILAKLIGSDGSGAASASNPLNVREISGHSAAVLFARTNDTNAYTANDVEGSATGSTAAIEFTNMGLSGGEVIITSAAMEIDITAIPAGMTSYRLYLYGVTPPSALGDNVAWDLPAGDRASYLGYIDLGSPVDLGSTLYVETTNINKQLKLAGTSIFAYLVTNGGYTPAASTVQKITIHTIDV